MKTNSITVSVLCTAYNHSKYIGQCLDSLLNQKTDFRYEIIIHDDASTDGTDQIIRSYFEKNPELIVPIFQNENQFSQRISIYGNYLLPKVRGKYIALCEGDDFWTDENKLQKQYDVMESNDSVHLCVHKVRTCEEDGQEKSIVFPKIKPQSSVIDSRVFIRIISTSWSFQTSSYFLKSEDIKQYYLNQPAFGQIAPVQDICWMMYLGNFGDVYYIDEIMSCYRVNSGSSWSRNNSNAGVEKQINTQRKFINTWLEFDSYTDYKYHDCVESAIEGYYFSIYKMENNYKAIIKNCKNRIKKCSKKYRAFIYFSAVFPFLPKIYEKFFGFSNF